MKCVNCGAEVEGNVCEYCGTHYRKGFVANCDETGHKGILTIGGKNFNVYISRVEAKSYVSEFAGRDQFGRIHGAKTELLRTFTLQEV